MRCRATAGEATLGRLAVTHHRHGLEGSQLLGVELGQQLVLQHLLLLLLLLEALLHVGSLPRLPPACLPLPRTCLQLPRTCLQLPGPCLSLRQVQDQG